ncbi:hypothetical protein B0H13DRAFT_2356795 [Mycena leptocephala]|nr:hypothetical protein B0H13DRAFT_2356795 [Mycena leptocephala]
MARIDLCVEPAHMPNFFSLFMNDSMDTVNMKACFRSTRHPPNVADLTPKRMDTVVQDTSQLMGPLLVKALINFAKACAAAKAAGVEPANIGHGIGMASGLLTLLVIRSMITGILARTALTDALYRRAVHLTPAALLRLPNSAVLNHVSTDVSRVDARAQWFHAAWTAPIQTTVCLIILLVELGPSALAGFALFLLIIPLQERIMAHQFSFRQASMKWTDERAGGSSMRVVKYFCYEGSFIARFFRIRTQELRGIRKI